VPNEEPATEPINTFLNVEETSVSVDSDDYIVVNNDSDDSSSSSSDESSSSDSKCGCGPPQTIILNIYSDGQGHINLGTSPNNTPV
jgi:hypothetical protein